jgi:hypothetical protein
MDFKTGKDRTDKKGAAVARRRRGAVPHMSLADLPVDVLVLLVSLGDFNTKER